MTIASRTPEGIPGRCPVCGATPRVDPSEPHEDAPCPVCGYLLTWLRDRHGVDERDFARYASIITLDPAEIVNGVSV